MNIFEGLLDSLQSLFDTQSTPHLADSTQSTGFSDSVNPETGLPLFGDGHGAIDIGGSTLGFDNQSSFHQSEN